MADHTKIEWTDATWNIVTGCQVVSPGCTNCYAMRLAGTRLRNIPSRAGLTKDTKAGPVWTGDVRFNREWLDQPLRWKRSRMIFVAAHGDLFADGVTDEQLDQIFAVMALAPQHIFQVLTKRPDRMRDYIFDPKTYRGILSAADDLRAQRPYLGSIPISDPRHAGFWPQLWLGVSVEDQSRAWERIPTLLNTPASVHWISTEPLLGELDISLWMLKVRNRIDWVVAGGESGPNARPMHPEWARSLRDQCADAGVPFLFKQWGSWQVACEANGHLDHDMTRNDAHWVDIDGRRHKPSATDLTKPYAMHRVAKSVAGRLLDGVEHNGFPPLPAHFKEQAHD